MISIRQLRYFLTLTETRHFRRAAEALHISQPALSLQIKQFETELGVTLIERKGSGFAITIEGRRVAMRARQILQDVQDLHAMAQQMQGVLTGELRLGLIPTVAPYLLPRLLPTIKVHYPDVKLFVREAITATLMDEIKEGKIDAAIAALPVSEEGVAHIPLIEDRFMLAVPKGRLSQFRAPVSHKMLVKEPLLFLDEGHCLRDQTLSFCQHLGYNEEDRLGAASLSTLLQMVANGLGVTLVPELAAQGLHTPEIAIVPLEEPQPSRTLALFWRAGSSRQEGFEALAKLLI